MPKIHGLCPSLWRNHMEEKDFIAILKQMTLEEKASLCSGETFWRTKAVDRLGIPSVWMTDGPNGLRKEKQGAGTNIMKPAETATCFPTAVTAASSWDVEILEEMGKAIAEEAKALGVSTVLGPGINIKRSPLCGRNFEYMSEDPFLAGNLATAYVNGVQKEGVGVSVKHFCANNQEHLRMSIDTIVDERALREIYLTAFETVIKNAQPATVMSSYNCLAGTHMSDHKRMLNDILREEWGFKGIVVSDWGGMNNRIESVKAGNDLEMPGNKGMNDRRIVKAVKDGTLAEEDLDRVVLRLIKFAFNAKASEVAGADQKLDAHHEVSRHIAEAGAVLLKNDDNALPLRHEQNIAVIGSLAKNLRYQGSGSSHINPPKTVSFYEAMQANGQKFEYAEGYTLKGDGYKEKLIKQACEVAKGKDAVLVFIGLTDSYESEGFDRKHINLPESHNILVQELAKVNENIIVVLSGGSPVKVSKWEAQAKAILNLYLGGQAAGEAAYNLIYGNVNPSGKLAETFPFRNHDNISSRYFPMGPRSVEYRESVYVGYRYFDSAEKKVQYPFGHGLSYTTFEYSDLALSAKQITEGEELVATFKIKNTGSIAGAEVAELYVSDVESSIFRPKKELKGFKKVFLNPGEEKEVSISLGNRAFSYYNVLIKDWHVESGDFRILIGSSSRDIRLEDSVNVISANPDAPIPNYHEVAPYYYDLTEEVEQKKRIPAEQFAALYGATLVENTPYVKGELTIDNSVEQCACTGVGKFLYKVLVFGSKLVAIGTENPDMITQSVKDMPLRSFSGFTGGLVSQMSVDGIVDMCNGTKGGFKKFCQGFRKKNR